MMAQSTSHYAPALVPLLHIDDSADDRLLLQEAISLAQTPFLYFGVNCIEAAIPYFGQRQPGASARYLCPGLVLLDYDLGKQTGADFLYWLRVLKEIKSIPVVVFSGCADGAQILECYALDANYVIRKANSLASLKNIVRTLHLSLLPRHGPNPVVFLQEYQPDPRVQGMVPSTLPRKSCT